MAEHKSHDSAALRKRTGRIAIRVNDAESQAIAEAADAEHLSVSAWLRRLVWQAIQGRNV